MDEPLLEPRREAAHADARRDPAAAAGGPHDHGLRHPRPGRGDDDGRPDRGHEPRRARAGRHARGALRAAREPLRRRLHRLARDVASSRPRSVASGCTACRARAPSSACGPSTRARGARAWSARCAGTVAFVEALGRETFVGVDVGDTRLVVFEEGRATRDVGETIEFGLVAVGPALLRRARPAPLCAIGHLLLSRIGRTPDGSARGAGVASRHEGSSTSDRVAAGAGGARHRRRLSGLARSRVHRRRAGGRPALPAGARLRRLRRPRSARSTPGRTSTSPTSTRSPCRSSPPTGASSPLRRLRLRARPLRRDVGQREPDHRHGGWHRWRRGRRRAGTCTCSTRTTRASSASAPSGEFQSQFGDVRLARPGSSTRASTAGSRCSATSSTWATRTTTACSASISALTGGPDRPPVVFGSPAPEPGSSTSSPGLAVDPGATTTCSSPTTATTASSASRGRRVRARIFGSRERPGQLDQPYDTAVDLAGRLFVADNQNHRDRALRRAALLHARLRRRRARRRASSTTCAASRSRRTPTRRAACSPPTPRSTRSPSSASTARSCAASGSTGAGRARSCSRATSRSRPTATSSSPTRAPTASQVLRANGRVDTWARISATLGTPTSGGGPREFRDPTAVAIDPRNGDVWVAEGGRHRVQRIPQDGDLAEVTIYGGPNASSAPGGFTGAARDRGRRRRHGVGGRHPQRPPAAARPGRPAPGRCSAGFIRPTAVAVLADGRHRGHRARPVAAVERCPARRRARGWRRADGLDHPEGVGSDGHGGVLVADTQRDRILHFDAQLQPLGDDRRRA